MRTAREMVKILEEEGLEDEVDIVHGGHVGLLKSEKVMKAARNNYEGAKEAGLNVSDVEWLNAEEVEKVSQPIYRRSRFALKQARTMALHIPQSSLLRTTFGLSNLLRNFTISPSQRHPTSRSNYTPKHQSLPSTQFPRLPLKRVVGHYLPHEVQCNVPTYYTLPMPTRHTCFLISAVHRVLFQLEARSSLLEPQSLSLISGIRHGAESTGITGSRGPSMGQMGILR